MTRRQIPGYRGKYQKRNSAMKVRANRRQRHRVVHSLTRNIKAIQEGPKRLQRMTAAEAA